MRPLFCFVIAVLAVGCKSDTGTPAKKSKPAADDYKQLRGEARGKRMLLEARNCVIGPGDARARACKIACELAHSNSCYYRGRHLERGDGVAVDLRRAMKRYLEGCNGGSGLACRGAARLVQRGAGTRADPTRAQTLFKRGRNYARVHCEQGHLASCVALGEMFAHAEGGPANKRAAALYLQRACANKSEAGCAALKRLAK